MKRPYLTLSERNVLRDGGTFYAAVLFFELHLKRLLKKYLPFLW